MASDETLRIDPEVAELIAILRNSVRNPGSVFDRAAQTLSDLAVANAALLELTASFADHPEGYDGPCWCAECRGSGDADPDAEVMA